jgi:hypothetical protein
MGKPTMGLAPLPIATGTEVKEIKRIRNNE